MPSDLIATAAKSTPASWQKQLSQAQISAQDLLEQLSMPLELLEGAELGAAQFPIRVPQSFIDRIEPGNPQDPLFLQIWPFSAEGETPPLGFVTDPLEENAANPVPGIVHKYQGRVLLIVNGSCAIHCRYCFRRHFPYEDNNLSLSEWEQALTYIENNPSINEVIMSGGDPLSSNDKRLFKLIDAIEAIPHVTRLRIHSRLPITLPNRITPDLCQRLGSSRLNIVMVVHANHGNEISQDVHSAMTRLRSENIHLLNQTVLLKGINDTTQALIDLSEQLFAAGVMPYYLHLLDPVIGAHHYHVATDVALSLMDQLQAQLPGFLVPKLVREVPGEASKTLIYTQKPPK
ncbi:EF-P beta-lysylation protein EpmB [Bermanella marisrubri]|uniref:L-lysine 2,3-aminomutase n=1 Tax=Bermanella marisrubri TaxID=207949 RepID=Q1N220_9GAMM|nr:EF-P beta-lysylation protein EpmB [Bermanella marisrubri]EAT12344.1 hypothetical protein RED65_15933 [Bermanella marisrubri]QIZ85427.1 EF-P beta-lysylation protein EpmB [Bermanella marisrubri]